MKRLLISTVYCPSELNKHWLTLQKKFIEQNTNNYDFKIYLNRIKNDKLFENEDILGEAHVNGHISEQHATCLLDMVEKFKKTDHDYYLILDSDCFPIYKNWLLHLIEKMGNKTVAAVVRTENLTPFPHPAAMLIKRSALFEDWFNVAISHQKNMADVPVYDPCMLIPLDKIHPMIRTNAKNYHPIFAGIYNYMFYHHGCGSRNSHYHTSSYHWGYPETHTSDSLFEIMISNPQDFFKDLSDLSDLSTKTKSKDEFEELKILLHSDKWARAVNKELICNYQNEEELKDRASIIIEELVGSLENKSFLDFGCGLGHSIQVSQAKMSVGYDLVPSSNFEWEKEGDKMWSTNLEKIKKNGPYDSILLYDVLDHFQNYNSVDDLMKEVKSLKSNNGKIYCRCHPICSRHASHLYETINKAFINLVFTEEELKSLGYEMEHKLTLHSYFPLKTYRELFQRVGLRVESEAINKDTVDNFFSNTPIVRKRIVERWRSEDGKFPKHEFPSFQMEQSFIDYILI